VKIIEAAKIDGATRRSSASGWCNAADHPAAHRHEYAVHHHLDLHLLPADLRDDWRRTGHPVRRRWRCSSTTRAFARGNLGFGSAISVAMLLIVGVLSLFYLRLLREPK
jgi:hypothetical protein